MHHLIASPRQVDLINYGLIPEFVGRFPIICSLQVRINFQLLFPCRFLRA